TVPKWARRASFEGCIIAAGLMLAAGAGVADEQPFGSPPAAWVGPVESTLGIALGDIDGDGKLDLVRGNLQGPSTLYFNSDTLFARALWGAPNEKTACVALGDVDGDGLLDLVRGNRGLQTTLYLGSNGRLADTPAWRSPAAEFTVSVALGDVDDD